MKDWGFENHSIMCWNDELFYIITALWKYRSMLKSWLKLGFWYSCHLKVSICQSFIIQTSLLITHSLDSPAAHHDLVSCFQSFIYLSLHIMQGFDNIGHFRILMVMLKLSINQLYLLTCFLKTLEACLSSSMAPVSKFELIGDEYLHAALECREVI